MNDETTYEELMERCRRLANIIVRNNHATEELIRAEVKKAKARAWDECVDYAPHTTHERKRLKADNPYKEEL